MEQVARNLTDAECGALHGQRYLLHDRDAKFCAAFRSILRDGGVEPLRLPPSSPDLNAFAERWVRSVKQECLSRLILFGETSLRRALNEYLAHFHAERPHQGKGNVLLFPEPTDRASPANRVECRQRLGGLLGIMPTLHEYFDPTGGHKAERSREPGRVGSSAAGALDNRAEESGDRRQHRTERRTCGSSQKKVPCTPGRIHHGATL